MSRQHMRIVRTAGIAAATLATIVLAACSSSGATSPSGPAAATATGGGPTGHAGAGAAGPVDVCAVVDAASASQLSGQQITTATALTGLPAQEYGCGYSNDDSSVQIEITVFEHDAADSYDLFSSGGNNTPVGGLGDKAFYDNDGTLYVLDGNDLIQVNGIDDAQACAALARPVLGVL